MNQIRNGTVWEERDIMVLQTTDDTFLTVTTRELVTTVRGGLHVDGSSPHTVRFEMRLTTLSTTVSHEVIRSRIFFNSASSRNLQR
jgi:hypothetical protein